MYSFSNPRKQTTVNTTNCIEDFNTSKAVGLDTAYTMLVAKLNKI